jgi:hypothetical protein
MHSFVLINQISFPGLVLIGFSFDSINRGMDLIVLIWLKLDTLLLIEVVNIFSKHRLFLVFQFRTQSMFRFELVIFYTIWLAIMVNCYDFIFHVFFDQFEYHSVNA